MPRPGWSSARSRERHSRRPAVPPWKEMPPARQDRKERLMNVSLTPQAIADKAIPLPQPPRWRASGRDLRKLLHGESPNVRAHIAAHLCTDLSVQRMLPAQAARLVGVSTSSVTKALGLPPRPYRHSDARIARILAQ